MNIMDIRGVYANTNNTCVTNIDVDFMGKINDIGKNLIVNEIGDYIVCRFERPATHNGEYIRPDDEDEAEEFDEYLTKNRIDAFKYIYLFIHIGTKQIWYSKIGGYKYAVEILIKLFGVEGDNIHYINSTEEIMSVLTGYIEVDIIPKELLGDHKKYKNDDIDLLYNALLLRGRKMPKLKKRITKKFMKDFDKLKKLTDDFANIRVIGEKMIDSDGNHIAVYKDGYAVYFEMNTQPINMEHYSNEFIVQHKKFLAKV